MMMMIIILMMMMMMMMIIIHDDDDDDDDDEKIKCGDLPILSSKSSRPLSQVQSVASGLRAEPRARRKTEAS